MVRHRDAQGRQRSYDFGSFPVPEPFQRSLAALFAAKCAPGGGWDSVESSEASWYVVRPFAEFVSELNEVPVDVDRLTTGHWQAYRLSLPPSSTGYTKYSTVSALLQLDARLTQQVREAMAQRFAWTSGREQAYSPEAFDQIRLAARRTFRAALLRIRENTAHLAAWRGNAFVQGGREWLLGEALDVLARTGDVPVYENPRTVRKRYRAALVGGSAEYTWGRLHLSRKEAAALAVLIVAELGLNATTVSEMPVPETLPGTAEAGVPVYRLGLEKRRRAGHRGRFESRNLTDSGADSSGRIITEALEATAVARLLLGQLDGDVDRLLIWRQTTPHDGQGYPKAVRVGPFGFGVDETGGAAWARSVGLSGSPLRRLRKTVNVLHRREPGQNTQDTHDRVYVVGEPQAQQAAVPVFADGALEALDAARRTVFTARLADQPAPEDRETATAGCADFEHSPFSPAGQGCGASFLLCTACPNARVTPAHLPRLAHLLKALDNLRGVVEPAVWDADWADAHARLTDLRGRLGAPVWQAALDAVTDTDHTIIDQLLMGDFDN
ncbi:hypothetical protein [Streptomyces stelliscabiei]|uniref:Uncharacterized protein n=1 Tax=Streptomyces stelliscabiei TaxID=146820 RepID=A0A8I0PF68_9ACTN|nr:hypothetical protein [Streptomyces stelliscabiei]MBE1603047.1 hypothetical protein [Streptomyces stelliscabiei]MDX2521641.1 hypothetical protein [Streptomyces stelliscabiei]